MNKEKKTMFKQICIWFLILFFAQQPAVYSSEVNVYSARKEALIKPLLDRFSTQSGIQVNLITGEADALIKRLEVERNNSPADILLTVDVARLHLAKEMDLLQPITSETLNSAIPQNYRDEQGYWYGLSLRSRVIVYARDRIDPGQLSTYEALANEEWKGRICIRSSSNVYNQSLVARLIAHNGIEETEKWARDFVRNFARTPKGGDRDQIKAVAAGQCDIALVNTYYLGGMLQSSLDEEKQAAEKVVLFWPNQNDRGTHMNISGAGITKSAKHTDEAKKLLEFLSSDESQRWYAEENYEYPVKNGVPVSEMLQQWGEFISDQISLDLLGQYNAEAVRLMDRAGWK